jgi:hypothetical protein
MIVLLLWFVRGIVHFAFFLPYFSGPGGPYFVRYSILSLYKQLFSRVLLQLPSSKALEFHHISSDSGSNSSS